MTEAETPVWLQQLKRAIRGNRRDAHNRYVQFATLGLDGKPRVRMVVFRGFSLSEASFFYHHGCAKRKSGRASAVS